MTTTLNDKEFDPNQHICCPKCKFEAVYICSISKKVMFINHDESIDTETITRDDCAKDGEASAFICNSIHCGEAIKPDLGLRWQQWCPCCDKSHGFTKKLRKESDLAGNAVRYDSELQRVHVLCDSCISLYTWKEL